MEGSSSPLLPYLAATHASLLAEGATRPWAQVEATMLFADVSGFTPLTERLARLGKVGAEELTDLLNQVFTALLSVADTHGGDCLKFGGDALLLMFSGGGHRDRAIAAAHGMLDALRPYRRTRTSAGTVSLGMSIGVHTGEPLFVLAGTTHRELIPIGPDVTRTLLAEASAGAGEVHVTDPVGGLPTQRPASAVALNGAATASIEDGVPDQLRRYLSGEAHEGEHRIATVGFVQCGGVDEMLSNEGPAAVAAALEAVLGEVQRACADHGVTFLSSDADKGAVKFIVAAGVPAASSDDELRLVHALAQVLAAPLPLPLRAGVARGRVFAVDLGSVRRRTFTLMGDAVNLAARIMANAQWHRLWVASDVLTRHRERLAIRALEPFAVKGKAAPVLAVEVEAVDVAVPRQPQHDARLVGRDRELEWFEDLLARAADGAGGTAEVVGDAGIGKSALVAAVAARAHDRGLEVLSLEAGRYTQVTSYFPLRAPLRARLGLTDHVEPDAAVQAVRDTVDSVAPRLSEWVPLLGPALGLPIPDTRETERLEPTLRADRTRATVVGLLRGLLSTPTLILVEDAHWLDSATSGVLAELATHASVSPWLLLTSRRPVSGGLELAADDVSLRLPLGPLSGDAAVELVRRALDDVDGRRLPPGTVQRLVERAAGNPLFLHELVNAAAHGAVAELPETVEAVVAASIDTLPAPDRTLLRWAAVLGARFPATVLAQMLQTPTDQLLDRLRSLDHFLDAADASLIRFRHALLRDVAYEGLPFRRRRELHALAGAILETNAGGDTASVAELLSTHFHMAHQDLKSWRYSRLAGERSERTAAPIEAALFYERALEAARRLPMVTPAEQADVAVRLGDVRELAGRYAEARAAYQLAGRLRPGDTVWVADLRRRAGVTWEREGRLVEALRAYQRARSTLTAADDQAQVQLLRARLAVAYGAARLRQGRYQLAQRELEAAVSVIGRRRDDEGYAVLAHAYRLLDWIDIETGVEREVPLRHLSLRLYDVLDDDYGRSNVLNNMGIAAYYRGDWNEAVELYGRSLDAARRAGALVFQALVLNNIAEVRSDQGHVADAERMLHEALEIWQGAGSAMAGMGLGNLGRAAARDGRLDEAARWYEQSRAVCRRMHEAAMLLETDARDAERLLLAAQPQLALELAEDVGERAVRLGGNPYVLMLADRTAGYALAQLGRPRAGWARIGRSLMRSRENRTDYETALNLEALARVGRLLHVAESESFAAQAATLFAQLGVVRTPAIPLPPPAVGASTASIVVELPEQPAVVGALRS